MHQGKYVFAQLTEFISRYQFEKCVEKYQGNHRIKNFTCWEQFLAMLFGQLTFRDGLRDIVICLTSQKQKLYHLGFRLTLVVSTLARANENRDWRIYHDFAQILIQEATKLYADDKEFALELKNTVYALDSTTIDLCLSIFSWAGFRKTKAAIKLHTLLNLRGNFPTFIVISDGKMPDVKILDEIEFEIGAFYLLDRGYVDFARLYKIQQASAFFVTRAKKNLQFKRLYSNKIDKNTGIRCDQIIRLVGHDALKNYPEKLRRIKYYDKKEKRYYVFLTNNFTIKAKLVADLYQARWQIEIFFKWIKQNLKIKSFWGHSSNAVKTQIWIAICAYAMVAIIKKKLGIRQSLYQILQILSITPFGKTPLNMLFQENNLKCLDEEHAKQPKLLDF